MTGKAIYAKRPRELRAMSDAELEADYESFIDTVGPLVIQESYYREELARRRSDRATTTMLRLTWAIGAMTVVNLAFVAYSALH